MTLEDQQQRQCATDPTRSFIVQAPAGSGKTELLTQRYLRLLSTVNAPEQIVALTFTRKAASEMRERILKALSDADTDLPVTSAHQQSTRQYASHALQQSQANGWDLLKQPGRLKIITIDSLCQTLNNAIPFHEQQLPYAAICDDSTTLYQQAVRACLKDMLQEAAWHQPMQLLLEHLDNRQDTLQQLLCDLLATREQWLSILYAAREQTRDLCEQALASIEQHELEVFQRCIPKEHLDELQTLSCQVAAIESNPDSLRYELNHWFVADDIDKPIAMGLAALLLTSEGKLRKSFDHHVGLRRDNCERKIYDELKRRSKELLHILDGAPDFLNALLRIKKLPPPYYEDSQWDVLQALLTILPLVAAHLHITFANTNQVDFTAVAQQALIALGDEDAPTDLVLYLDNVIHHLLLDEFQDTSITQFQLMSKLVQGWMPGDGKTLFVVGDPMQSIYRFRQAEVGLFLKAKQQGIGMVKLEPLELCCNFRSTPAIVAWINSQFHSIFPHYDDIESGAVSFHPSVTHLKMTDDTWIEAEQYDNKKEEALAIVNKVAAQLQQYPLQSIAILVRSRAQLSDIIPLLRERGIPFQGVDIEKLSSLPHLQDIWSLTKALLMPADRLAWLSFLRSPWAGISLADLLTLANFDQKKSIIHALAHLDDIDALSDEGKVRAQFLYTVLQKALAARHQQPLDLWLLAVIKQLHGDWILDSLQRADLEQFFQLLLRFAKQGQIVNVAQFEQELDSLYSQRVTQASLQIMTIHKSKGLEFDCVILPGLGSKSKRHDKPLLRWLKLPSLYDDDLLLLSPIYAAHQKQCLLYHYLGDVAAEKDDYEQQRLLYVAVTRAKKRLYLFDNHTKIQKKTARDLLQKQVFNVNSAVTDVLIETNPLPELTRLPQHFYQLPIETSHPQQASFAAMPEYSRARMTGIIAHDLLQWICDRHPSHCDELPWPMMDNQLKSQGFSPLERAEAIDLLQSQIKRLMSTPKGQWIIQQHNDEHNEYELLVKEHDQITTKIIDRTFIFDDKRWIIDFKTGREDESAQKSHQKQVNHYASLFADNGLAIHCGLYYLATNQWVEWAYVAVVIN